MSHAPGPILVTGASGFLGRAVMMDLATQGLPAVAIGRPLDDVETLRARLGQVRPRAILHLAGRREWDDSAALFEANVGLAARLLEAAERLDAPPVVVLAGSTAEYGPLQDPDLPVAEDVPCRPATPYGVSKLAQTLLGRAAHGRGLPALTARLFNLVGPDMPAHLPLGRFAAEIAALDPGGGTIDTGPLDIDRDFVLVADAARALIGLALTPKATGGVVNVCTGRATSLRVLAEGLIAASGKAVRLRETGTVRPGEGRNIGDPGRLRRLGLGLPEHSTKDLIAGLVHEPR